MNEHIGKDDLIIIVERKCSDKLQPSIGKGTVLKVSKVFSDRGLNFIIGTNALDKNSKTHRINDSRFTWKKTSYKEVFAARERILKEKSVQAEIQLIQSNFSFRDHLRVSFYPRVIEQTIWQYIGYALEDCAKARISLFLPITRSLRALKKDYDNELSKDLSIPIRRKLSVQAAKWMQDCGGFFTQFLYTVKNAYLRKYTNVNMFLVYAYLAHALIKYLRDYNDKVNLMLIGKLGQVTPSYEILQITKAYNLLEGFLPDDISFLDNDKNIAICGKVFMNKLDLIEFGD